MSRCPLAKRRRRRQPVRNSAARDLGLLRARPRRRSAGRSSIRLRCATSIASLLALVDILVLNETELGAAGEDGASRDRRARAFRGGREIPADATRPDDLRHARAKRGVLALIGRRAVRRAGPRRQGRRHHRRRRLLRRRARGAAGGGRFDARGARLRQCRRLDLRAADGRRAVDADGGGGVRLLRDNVA